MSGTASSLTTSGAAHGKFVRDRKEVDVNRDDLSFAAGLLHSVLSPALSYNSGLPRL